MSDEFEGIAESADSAEKVFVDVFWRVKILSSLIFNDVFVLSPDFAETEVFPGVSVEDEGSAENVN